MTKDIERDKKDEVETGTVPKGTAPIYARKKPKPKYSAKNPLPGDAIRVKPEYLTFVKWFAMPKPLRAQSGLGASQRDFAEINKLDEGTLTRWKQMPEFKSDVIAQVSSMGFEHIGDVLWAWLQRLKAESTAGDIKLVLEWLAEWKETMRLEPGASREVKELLRSIYEGGRKGNARQGPKVVPKKYKK